jgi:hypothetical protein
MYARVARFTGADQEQIESNLAAIREQSASGPPEGVPGKAFTLLADKANGTVVAIGFFETEEDMRQGDRVLNEMSPPQGSMGSRASVDLCEVEIQIQAP